MTETATKTLTVTEAPKHPAKFSPAVLDAIVKYIPEYASVLDPFAGVGGIHELRTRVRGVYTKGIELEPEWARQHPLTDIGDALMLPVGWEGLWDVVCTSPSYGTRMGDHHNAKDQSRRITYKHYLGRDTSPGSSCPLQWGVTDRSREQYKRFHVMAWQEARRVMKPFMANGQPGRFVLNISNHIRGGEEMMVAQWHRDCLRTLGFRLRAWEEVETPRMKMGANAEARPPCEYVAMFERGDR